MTNIEAQKRLKGTFTKDKNEIMFTQFGINYAKEPEIFKRGNIFIRMSGDKKAKKREMKQLAKEKQAEK